MEERPRIAGPLLLYIQIKALGDPAAKPLGGRVAKCAKTSSESENETNQKESGANKRLC